MDETKLIKKLCKLLKGMRSILDEDEPAEFKKAIRDVKNLGIPTPSRPGNEMQNDMRTPEEQSSIRDTQKQQRLISQEKLKDMIANPHKYIKVAQPSDINDPEVQRRVALRQLTTTVEGQKADKDFAAENKLKEEEAKAKFRTEAHSKYVTGHKKAPTVDVKDALTGEKVIDKKTGQTKQVPLVQLADVKEQQKQFHNAPTMSATPSEFLPQPGNKPESNPNVDISPADLAATQHLQAAKEMRTLTPEETITHNTDLLHSTTARAPAHIRDGLRADKTLQLLYNEKKKASLPKATHDKIDYIIGLRRQELENELEQAHQAKKGQ
jgi:hypothetical protein